MAPKPVEAPTNRLAGEKSPYLLQHQHNPVDWYPWGEEAFAKARREDLPIFLSIGYSTCHWCHVMERESFENEEIAAYLNSHFVSIKADREERPDIDKIYMTAVQAMTGQGGWPLNCVLTPDLKPFFCGTYFPPESKYGRLGFLEVLEQIHRIWSSRRDEILTSAVDFHERLQGYTARKEEQHPLSKELLDRAFSLLKSEYDPQNGGFGNAPKFPRPSQPEFILSQGWINNEPEAIQMVLETCDHMASGGIRDHLGGGFHRYSVDSKWLVPHFEKMLYDNAQLVNLYLDAYLASQKREYAEVVHETLEYVLRDMTDPQGGFYSAEDADSEGKEGKFYCWTTAEIKKVLTPAEQKIALRYWGLTDDGNFKDHSDPDPLPGQNVLSIVNPLLTPEELKLLNSAKNRLVEVRERRTRPHRDDKVLASWNGMMLGAMARAFAVFTEKRYLAAAEKNLAFLQQTLWDAPTQTLYNRWRDGERDQVQLLDAYANLLAGVLDLYEATLDPKHLKFAINLAETLLRKFYDPAEGGFYQSESNDLILRIKDNYDGAEPSGNSVAVLALLRLGVITGHAEFTQAAEKTLQLFSRQLHALPQAVPYLLMGLSFLLENPHHAIITGDVQQPLTRKLIHTIHSVFQPNKAILGTLGPVDPFTKTLLNQCEPCVFWCAGNACQPPTSDPNTLRQIMRQSNGRWSEQRV